MKDLLYEKFTTVLTRPGRGGQYPYIKWQDVADRMNKVFGTTWSSQVISQRVLDNNIVVRVRVTVQLPDTNQVVWQEGYGGAPNDERNEAGNAFKAAYSKALKDACKKWGVGLYLEEEGEQDSGGHSTPDPLPAGYVTKEAGVSSGPLMPNIPPTPEPTTQHVVSTPQTGGMPLPPGVEMKVSSGIVIEQIEETPPPIGA